MTFKALDLAREPVQPFPECRLHSFGIIRRQKGGKRRLDDECLMQALATSIVGKLSRKLGRQTKYAWSASLKRGPDRRRDPSRPGVQC